MDIFTKNRLLIWLSIVLTVLNIATITAFWIFLASYQSQEKPKEKEKFADVSSFIKTELGFDSRQSELTDTLFRHYISASDKIREIIRINHDSINNQIIENTNYIDIYSKIDTLGAMKARLDKLTYRFFEDLYKVCNDSQKIKYRSLFREISKMMLPGPKPTKKK